MSDLLGPVRIAPQTDTGFRLKRHQVLRITDPCGEQVADLFAFKADDLACSLSSGRVSIGPLSVPAPDRVRRTRARMTRCQGRRTSLCLRRPISPARPSKPNQPKLKPRSSPLADVVSADAWLCR